MIISLANALLLFAIATCALMLVRLRAEHTARVRALSVRLARTRTAFKRKKAQLRARTERYKLTLRAIDEVIFQWNARTNVLRWSANGARYFGCAPRSSKAWPLLKRCLDERDRNRVLQDLQAFLARNEAVWQSEFTLQRRGGPPVQVSVRGILERDAAGNPWRMIGAVTDMTAARIAKESARALARAARLASVGEITAAITHEVNQPLAAILNNAETGLLLLQRKQASAEISCEILDDIRRDALRGSQVVRRTRALLQEREMVRERVSVPRLITDVIDLLWLQARRRGIDLCASPGSTPPVHADEVHLQQVVINLIVNALDATEFATGGVKRVEVSSTHRSGKVTVRVCDTGRGIPPTQLESIFESFNTTKAEGLGLGLSIARSIVAAHGGRIFAENNKFGPGATVWFELPIAVDSTTDLVVPVPHRTDC